jgi:acetyl-CoA carboxylase biotin carboxyl carrier protein
MDFKEISELVKLVQKSNLIELKIKKGDFEISMRTEKYGQSKTDEQVKTFLAPQSPPSPPPPGPTAASTVEKAAEINADQAPRVTEEPVVSPDYLEIRSPMVGTFYRSSSPEKPPYIKVGDSIQQGSVVCIIEAMKLFNEIESEITGRIVKVAVEDATPVEYDQVLFLVER